MLLIFICTVSARATVAIPVIVAGGALIASIFVALGLIDDGGLPDLVERCVEDMTSAGWLNSLRSASVMRNGAGALVIPAVLINAVKDWLFDNDVYSVEGSYTAATMASGTTFTTSSDGYIEPSDLVDYALALPGYGAILSDIISYYNLSPAGWTFCVISMGKYGPSNYQVQLDFTLASGVRYNDSPASLVPTDSSFWSFGWTSDFNPQSYKTGYVYNNMAHFGMANGNGGLAYVHNIGSLVAGADGYTLTDNIPAMSESFEDTYADWAENAETFEDDDELVLAFPMTVGATVSDSLALTQSQAQALEEVTDPAIEKEEGSSLQQPGYYAVDLTSIFPFCIPFDVYRFFDYMNAAAEAPRVVVPLNVSLSGWSLQHDFEIDLSGFDTVAAVLRTMELLSFCVGLAMATRKLIKW